MKTIQVGVNCKYWNRAMRFEIEVDDDATEEEIDILARDAAVQESGFDYWVQGGV